MGLVRKDLVLKGGMKRGGAAIDPKWGNIKGNINDQTDLMDILDASRDYEILDNHPSIEGNTLIGDKTYAQLGLPEITPQEIDDMFDDLIYGG